MDDLITLLAQPSTWAALTALIVMEVVLGVDNLIFISILTNKLPEASRAKARAVGLGGALIMRILLLFTLSYIVALRAPVLDVLGQSFSWRDIILILGGVFLLYKATKEIHEIVETTSHGEMDIKNPDTKVSKSMGFGAAISQILLLDLVFSIDSILTAVGMTSYVAVMVISVVVAVLLMFLASAPLSSFIAKNTSIVILALGFLLMIGMVLIMEGFGAHIDKGYIYAAMAFAAFIEGLQMLKRKKT